MRRHECEIAPTPERHERGDTAGVPGRPAVSGRPVGGWARHYADWLATDRRLTALLLGLDLLAAGWAGALAWLSWTTGGGGLWWLAAPAALPLLWLLGFALLLWSPRAVRLERELAACGLVLLPWPLARGFLARGGPAAREDGRERAAAPPPRSS